MNHLTARHLRRLAPCAAALALIAAGCGDDEAARESAGRTPEQRAEVAAAQQRADERRSNFGVEQVYRASYSFTVTLPVKEHWTENFPAPVVGEALCASVGMLQRAEQDYTQVTGEYLDGLGSRTDRVKIICGSPTTDAERKLVEQVAEQTADAQSVLLDRR